MGQIDRLIAEYSAMVMNAWQERLSGPQRVWMVVYDPDEERRLRYRLKEFETATTLAGHDWYLYDATDSLAEWVETQPYRDDFFANPLALQPLFPVFAAQVEAGLRASLDRAGVNGVVALVGAGSMYPYARISTLVKSVETYVAGRLVVFFPGEIVDSNWRLFGLSERDGWNYMAVPITGDQ